MPSPATVIAAARRVPWTRVLIAAQFVFRKGSAGWQALSDRERAEFKDLLAKSKGLPQNLSLRDRTRIRELAGKALQGARHA